MFTLLIVDDREIFRRQFKRFAIFREDERFQVRFEAQNGEEAMALLRREQVDIMITDIRMPIMDGLELLRQTRTEQLCPCIVLLSEYADFSYAKQGIVLGAFDYIIKPIDLTALGELLERCAAHLNCLAKGIGYDNNAVRILPKLVLKNDDYARIICQRLASQAAGIHFQNPEEAWSLLKSALAEMRQQILVDRPHMQRYCEFDRLFEFEQAATAEQLEQSFCDQVAEIQKEINKFAVHSKSELILSVCNTIVKNIENNLSLQSVANLHFVNKAYLSHLFKQELGISFVDYLTFVKLERAKILLRSSDMKIYEIGNCLGYADTEYFSRVFKQYAGITSTEYRQSKQSGRDEAR